MAEISAPERPSRRSQRRLQHLDLSRAQLLDAAEEVFGAKGYYATTLKEVADLAEFSVGSVYSFFDNKGDLFAQVFLRRGAEIVEAMRDVVDGGTPVEQLHGLVDAEVGFFREHPHFARLFLRSSNLVLPRPGEEDPDDPQQRSFQDAMGLHAELFRQGQRSGDLCPGDPDVLARMLGGMITAFLAMDVASGGSGSAHPDAALATLHALVEDAFRP
ncbi:MAG TPA: TetR/AcrR family transcriptional regulator [Acidimicrobiales bacterium]|nr:TetR/AcrR family transcriptional regulator [Acidimicrobiales bacterium]